MTPTFFDTGLYGVLKASLWCRDILTLEAARELDEQSECLQCLPEDVRRDFIESLKWASLDSECLLLYRLIYVVSRVSYAAMVPL
jgi:hypothetical protein